MVDHTRLIRALTLSSLRNNTKRWLPACLKGRTASCRYNFTLSPSFHARVWGPTFFNFFASTFIKSNNLLTNSYADDFTVSCSNSNVNPLMPVGNYYMSRFQNYYFSLHPIIQAR